MRATGDIQGFFRRQAAPVTMGLICGMVAVTVLLFLMHNAGEAFAVGQPTLGSPWVYFTYPFVNNLDGGFGVIMMLFLAFWLYWVGTTIERDLGSLRIGILWLVASVIEAAFVAIGAQLLRIGPFWWVAGALLPVSVLTVIWGIRNRTAAVRLMMCIPITGYWMAWLTVAIVFVEFGRTNLLLGAAACLPMGLAWAYASDRIPKLAYGRPVSVYRPSKAQRQKEAAFFDDVRKREQERQDRERLRKLFEGSIEDEK